MSMNILKRVCYFFNSWIQLKRDVIFWWWFKTVLPDVFDVLNWEITYYSFQNYWYRSHIISTSRRSIGFRELVTCKEKGGRGQITSCVFFASSTQRTQLSLIDFSPGNEYDNIDNWSGIEVFEINKWVFLSVLRIVRSVGHNVTGAYVLVYLVPFRNALNQIKPKSLDYDCKAACPSRS